MTATKTKALQHYRVTHTLVHYIGSEMPANTITYTASLRLQRKGLLAKIEIDRRAFFIMAPESILDELSIRTLQILYPLQINHQADGTAVTIVNKDDIQLRWQAMGPLIEAPSGDDITANLLQQAHNRITNHMPPDHILQHDLFIQTYLLSKRKDQPAEIPMRDVTYQVVKQVNTIHENREREMHIIGKLPDEQAGELYYNCVTAPDTSEFISSRCEIFHYLGQRLSLREQLLIMPIHPSSKLK
ncbi:hypothetical protein [Chitinophaga sp. MM2321]|uniref:hypothetical protein n=1 Tax=Chitinophaga sp. MM2321 TaxID=3137178 RepID=UPI0032D5A2E8